VKVLLVLEDPTHDRYVVQPIVERMLATLSIPARVEVLTDPHPRGVDQALDPTWLGDVIDIHPMIDWFLLVVDRDCDRTHNERRAADREGEQGGRLVTCVAHQEVEAWMLALQDDVGVPWPKLRADCDLKERYAEPYLRRKGWGTDVGKGRKRAMERLAGQYKRLLSLCSELAELERRLRDRTSTPPSARAPATPAPAKAARTRAKRSR
jgi:hypothetical protein